MGCSNPHPHGQVWASDTVPNDVVTEMVSFDSWRKQRHSCLLCDYIASELRKTERVVVENEYFTAVVPYWAYWPFELLIVPNFHVPNIATLDGPQKDAMADVLRKVTCKYDNLFETSFPYSLGVHQLATSASVSDVSNYHLHIHIHPPLLRNATIK